MTSLQIVDLINMKRKLDGNESTLRHSDFMAKVPQVVGAEAERNFSSGYLDQNKQQRKCFNFPKRESMLMLMSYDYDLQAAVYDRMEELEKAEATTVAALTEEERKLRAGNMLCDMLNLNGSSKQMAITKLVKAEIPYLLPMLPDYAIDAPIVAGPNSTSTASSQPTLALTALLKKHGIKASAVAVNKKLHEHGFLDRKSRPSKSKGEKQFWCVSVTGLEFGKNVTSQHSQRETQPHWFESTFLELLEICNLV